MDVGQFLCFGSYLLRVGPDMEDTGYPKAPEYIPFVIVSVNFAVIHSNPFLFSSLPLVQVSIAIAVVLLCYVC